MVKFDKKLHLVNKIIHSQVVFDYIYLYKSL